MFPRELHFAASWRNKDWVIDQDRVLNTGQAVWLSW